MDEVVTEAMTDDDSTVRSRCLGEGRYAARVGRSMTTNPYLVGTDTELRSWADGYRQIDLIEVPTKERARIYAEGRMAAATGQSVIACPYDEDQQEGMEVWLIGYASDTLLETSDRLV